MVHARINSESHLHMLRCIAFDWSLAGSKQIRDAFKRRTILEDNNLGKVQVIPALNNLKSSHLDRRQRPSTKCHCPCFCKAPLLKRLAKEFHIDT